MSEVPHALPTDEWLETDGLGGFASGTVGLVRSRRYHALLMRASGSPSHRSVLVNGLDAFVNLPEGRFALSAQRYQPGVTAPDGAERAAGFTREPWPAWTFSLPGGRTVLQEIFVVRGQASTVVTWALTGDASGVVLDARPFFSGRDPHATHHENAGFRFDPVNEGDTWEWRPYPGIPSVALKTNGTYAHTPGWYRRFLYEEEQARGLDCTEDLAAPGVFSWDLSKGPAVLILSSPATECEGRELGRRDAETVAGGWRKAEQARRGRFADPIRRAADSYIVQRDAGHTIIAGYPWFTDWGRDTFISLRGLCLATERFGDARSILLAWADLVSEGMLPNYFPEGGDAPEYNSVDASLWYVVAVHDYLRTAGRRVGAAERRKLGAAVTAILTGYAAGTRFGIRADSDGLLFAGRPGVQLTWMDAKVGDWVVTPRIGKPVEVQALWINALRAGGRFDRKWDAVADFAQNNFRGVFWNPRLGWLNDVADVDFDRGRHDASLRANQILAVGGLPFPVLTGSLAEKVVAVVEKHLLTPMGLRTLDPGHADYRPRYEGGVLERDGAYHQGTVWPWLLGPFVEAWLRVGGGSAARKAEARTRFLEPLRAHLDRAGLGHVSEIADAEPPHRPRGCPFQAWSLAELLRMDRMLA